MADEKETTLIFEAGEPGMLGLYGGADNTEQVHLDEDEKAVIWWRPDRAEDPDDA